MVLLPTRHRGPCKKIKFIVIVNVIFIKMSSAADKFNSIEESHFIRVFKQTKYPIFC